MIAIAFFLFAVLLVMWMLMPGGERRVSLEVETQGLQPERQTV